MAVEETNVSLQSQLSLEERFKLIRSIGEECIQDDELEKLLANKSHIICYDGFEPSGRMHIAQGVMKVINVNKLIRAGCKVKIWIADRFALMNKKMGGDMEKIKVVGDYFIEVWKGLGMDSNVEFIWSSKEIKSRCNEYWDLVTDISMRTTLGRIMRCCQIMGRSEKDDLSAAQLFYPCMQCADIFFLQADICQMGMDQRKVNMLAREYCDDTGREDKPIILSHHMLPGLQEGQEKMSKSDPSSSIFMEDEEWTFTCFEDLVIDYENGELHPGDLKPALAKALNCILKPVRDHFSNDEKAKELLKNVKGYNVSR
ncbi:hypothetical protein OROGR_012483 [Orobanche gracilis]